MSNLEKSKRYLDGFERTELTDADIDGKTPAEIEKLKLGSVQSVPHAKIAKFWTPLTDLPRQLFGYIDMVYSFSPFLALPRYFSYRKLFAVKIVVYRTGRSTFR